MLKDAKSTEIVAKFDPTGWLLPIPINGSRKSIVLSTTTPMGARDFLVH